MDGRTGTGTAAEKDGQRANGRSDTRGHKTGKDRNKCENEDDVEEDGEEARTRAKRSRGQGRRLTGHEDEQVQRADGAYEGDVVAQLSDDANRSQLLRSPAREEQERTLRATATARRSPADLVTGAGATTAAAAAATRFYGRVLTFSVSHL